MKAVFMKKLTLFIFLLPLITGCSLLKKTADPKPQDINVQIFGTPQLNPDLARIASPIRIDIYELKEIGEFTGVSYKELMDNEKVLSDKLIRRTQYIVHPDSIKYIPLKVDGNAKYLGVAAGYLNIDTANWKLSLLKQPNKNNNQNYLYVVADQSGLQQISQKQMTGLLKDYAKRHPNDPTVKENGKLVIPKPDYSKGIYTQKTF
ncbi:type VI secretion system lipoprotein TssJ [Faucicola atlantae]|uniref:type VI secretion system lipoprotein TssJ n=1 Tax=Faucicola atlantae TaxID=34059 RepID=UPI0025B25F3D|nr:type VI secretion system lipoprotein TssJ [Moraxella atlantae]